MHLDMYILLNLYVIMKMILILWILKYKFEM